MSSAAPEKINHPAHYLAGKIEVIDFIEDQKFDFHIGNVVKYLARAGRKHKDSELEDLKKAAWYLQRKIVRLENEMPTPHASAELRKHMRAGKPTL